MRFDAVYASHFTCNLRRTADHPDLSGYLRDLYQMPGVAETVDLDQIKRHYYMTHASLNPSRIVPKGPALDLWVPHGRDRLGGDGHNGRMNRRRHPATTVFLALSGLFALGAFVQPFTAGLGIFGESFDFHEGLGFALHGITLLAFLAALIAPTRRRDAPLAFAVFAVVSVQLLVVNADTAAVAALHPFLGVSALLLAAWSHLRARTPAASSTSVPVG